MYKYIESQVFITENKMAATIDSIKANINKGYARPNLFTVDIGNIKTSKAEKYRINCFQAQLPGNTIATTEKDDGFRSVAYKKIFADVILGFYCSADLAELKYFQSWIDNIVDKKTNQFNLPENYFAHMTIGHRNRQWAKVAEWKLHDVYPKQVDAIQLDYGTNDTIMTCNVTMTYRHYDVTYFNGGVPDIADNISDIQNNITLNKNTNFNQKVGNQNIMDATAVYDYAADMIARQKELVKKTTGGAGNMTNEVE